MYVLQRDTMSISLATFKLLDDALSNANYSYVDVIAVIAEVGVTDRHTFFSNGIREFTLKDYWCVYFIINYVMAFKMSIFN